MFAVQTRACIREEARGNLGEIHLLDLLLRLIGDLAVDRVRQIGRERVFPGRAARCLNLRGSRQLLAADVAVGRAITAVGAYPIRGISTRYVAAIEGGVDQCERVSQVDVARGFKPPVRLESLRGGIAIILSDDHDRRPRRNLACRERSCRLNLQGAPLHQEHVGVDDRAAV